jgi:UDP-glucuronate 4-epimerase
MKIMVTGTAGFIGSFVAIRLAERGDEIVGVDNINAYYDVNLKYGRLERDGFDPKKAEAGEWVQSKQYPGYRFKKIALEDKTGLEELFQGSSLVCHLAGRQGVRYSLTSPHSYFLEHCRFLPISGVPRHHRIGHLVLLHQFRLRLNETYLFRSGQYGSSVSLCGNEKANELMAPHSHLFGIPTPVLIFTVYGPWKTRHSSVYFYQSDS